MLGWNLQLEVQGRGFEIGLAFNLTQFPARLILGNNGDSDIMMIYN